MDIYSSKVIRSHDTFWMKSRPENYVSLKTDYCYSISIKDGKYQRHYYFPLQYSVSKK